MAKPKFSKDLYGRDWWERPSGGKVRVLKYDEGAGTIDWASETGLDKGTDRLAPEVDPAAPAPSGLQIGGIRLGLPASLAPHDPTDKLVREARTAQLLRLRMGQGRRSTFLTGPFGAPGAGLSRKLLGG